MTAQGLHYPRFDDPLEALSQAPNDAGLLLLNDRYPTCGVTLKQDHLTIAREKNLRIYVEYPSAVPGLTFREPKPTEWERVVAASDFFAPELEKDDILALHGCWFLPLVTIPNHVHLAVARVAGYDKAVFGLPQAAFPILFELPESNVLVSTSKLSHFITGRYGPTKAWNAIWTRLIRWLDPEAEVEPLRWEPDVGIRYSQEERLNSEAEANAFHRSVCWFQEHTMFTSWGGKKGIIEGYASRIDHNGKQLPLTTARADCISETAMVFAYDWMLRQNPASRQAACELLDLVWSAPDFVHNDVTSPAYGLLNWYQRGPIFYGDDNARAVLSSITAGRLLHLDQWDAQVLRCLLANLRTTGPQGFRRHWIGYPDSFSDGRSWQYYRDTPFTRFAPHYQAYLWACNLWAYALTGYDGFLNHTKHAIRMTMEAYPHSWKWTNGLTQEIARMILPLSFLVRIENTSEHRSWLDTMCSELLKQMQPCGAIAEMMGPLENGSYPPPQSNEAYGTREASLLQMNGDPVCDLLYTVNFAFLGLHEAAAATGEDRLTEAENRMAEFLCRIQVTSSRHSYLDGAWMRSFDFKRWEYWGSSADSGWAAWCAETGWTNTWIASVFAMRQLHDQLFDLSPSERWKSLMPELLNEMEIN